MSDGSAEILQNIEKVMNVVSKNKTEALIEIGERGVGYLKKETPVDTGRLRNSMSYTIDNKVYTPIDSNSDNLNPTRDKDAVFIGTNIDYAIKVEYLSKSAGFMLRAYKKTKQSAEQIFAKVLGRGIR